MDSYVPSSNPLRVKSIWRAPLPPPEIDTRIEHFCRAIRNSFAPTSVKHNLSPTEQRILREIKSNPNITIAAADKNLGPVGINTSQYIKWGMQHLKDTTTYEILTEATANEAIKILSKEIFNWTRRFRESIEDDVIHYIRYHLDKAMKDPFGYFYLLIKLHKSPISTRPVCSDCASLPHALGKWVDTQLQPIVQRQATYFKDSYSLKKMLDKITLPPNASIFTYDAISMYTNIDTNDCIKRLTDYLMIPQTTTTYPHLSPRAVVEALSIVMKNNRMKFGELIVHQHKGIAMGMSPAPTIANLYVAIFENEYIVNKFSSHLHFLRRFIDDGFGIWLRDSNQLVDDMEWNKFKNVINSMGLTWEFTERSHTTVFMDLTITLKNGRFNTAIYAKPMALHLYIPPASSHAPGIATGLIFGHTLRVHRLCSHQQDIDNELQLFFQRLVDRGYSPNQILPLFRRAESNARARVNLERTMDYDEFIINKDKLDNHTQLFFHLPFHPSNPNSAAIQKIWRDNIAMPVEKSELSDLSNKSGCKIDITKLTVAYSRGPNLGNLLSCRKLKNGGSNTTRRQQ